MGRKKATTEVTARRRVDPETGELLLQDTTEHTFYSDAEDDYIKVYYASLASISGAFNDNILVRLLIASSSYLTYADNSSDGYALVTLTPYNREKLAEVLGCSERTVRRAIKDLCDCDIFRKLGRDTYAVSPFVIARGAWKDIKVLRVHWLTERYSDSTIEVQMMAHVSTAEEEPAEDDSEDFQQSLFDDVPGFKVPSQEPRKGQQTA